MSKIYEEYEPLMLRYALSLTKNKEMAEDAVHNAFLAIIRRKEKYLSLSCRDLRNLIVIITKNKCIDLLRQRKKYVDIQIDDMGDVLAANELPIEEHVILKDEFESVREHLMSLDERSRLVLEMKYILGMTYNEIGEHLGLTSKHVETCITRAKEKVRRLAIKGWGEG
jgi:RNA polymerase sigma-70 factor (ECF subfamily)